MEKNIGKTLENMWLKAGYTSLGEVNKATGITVATLSRIKNDVQKPSPETLKKLSLILGVDHVELMKIAGHMSVDIASTTATKEPKKPNDLLKFLEQSEVMFDGETYNLDEEDKKKLRDALEYAFWHAKQKNKRKK